MKIKAQTKNGLLLLASLSGPTLVFLSVLAGDKVPASEYIKIGSIISVGAIICCWLILWILQNPTSRLHQNGSIERFARLALATGPIWILYEAASERYWQWDEELLKAFCISVASWFLVNLIGWALAGSRGRQQG